MIEDKFGFKPFIFIETGFIRNSQPIFALALMESTRRIQIPKEIYRLPLDFQIPRIEKIIKKHYLDCNGKLPLWGKVKYYKYFYAEDVTAAVVFNAGVSVKMLGGGISPPPAKVLLNGKRLF